MYLDFGESLAGVTICYIQCLRRSLDFARDYFGEPIPSFELILCCYLVIGPKLICVHAN